MGFRFSRRFKILPGVTLNLSKSGLSVSLGPRGAKLTVGPKHTRTTIGIPGTGLSYTEVHKHASKPRSAPTQVQEPEPEPEPLYEPTRRRGPAPAMVQYADADLIGFQQAVDALYKDHVDEAIEILGKCSLCADVAFLTGILLLRYQSADLLDAAHAVLFEAVRQRAQLGSLTMATGVDLVLHLPIDDTTDAQIIPDTLGAALALAETLQLQGKIRDALEILHDLEAEIGQHELIAISRRDLRAADGLG